MLQEILVVHDGSAMCDDAFELSVQWAGCFGGRLRLLAISPRDVAQAGESAEIEDDQRESLEDLLVNLARVARNSCIDLDGEVVAGDPLTEIVKQMKNEKSDHLVFTPTLSLKQALPGLLAHCELAHVSVTLVMAQNALGGAQ